MVREPQHFGVMDSVVARMNAAMSCKVWLGFGLGLVTLMACESSDDGDSPGGDAGRGGSAGASAGSSSGGKAGSAAGGSSNAGSSSGGKAGSAAGGSGGKAGSAGASSGEAGEASGGTPSGEGGAGGDDGEGGAGGDDMARPAVAYISTLLGELLVASLDPTTGVPTLLPSSPIEIDGVLNGVVVSPNRKFVFVPADPTRIETYAIQANGSLPAAPSSTVEVEDENGLLSMALDPLGRFAYGLIPFSDSIHVFKVSATGVLTPSGEPIVIGAPPNHREPAFLAPDPSGRFVYVTQLGAGAEATDDGVRGYSVDQTTGALSELEGSPFDAGTATAGALVFRPDGKFLFGSGGGLNAFAVNEDTGALELVDGSPFSVDVQSDPWAPNITMDPKGKRLYVSNFIGTQNITGFDIDAATGALQKLPGVPVRTVAPYSIALGPGGRFLYVGDDNSELSAFSVSRETGALTKLAASPFDFGGLEADIAFVTLN